jgi:hypothetical protein
MRKGEILQGKQLNLIIRFSADEEEGRCIVDHVHSKQESGNSSRAGQFSV